MRHQEKKYRVDSFAKIQKTLEEKGIEAEKEVTTTHYYAPQKGNDVVKFVKFTDKNEIHILEETRGKFSLKENVPVENSEAGFQWLKDKGYKTVSVVKMVNADYGYKNGIVGLYVINDFLHSIILDFPEGQHEAIEKELGFGAAEVISVPYNKLLEQIGKLRSMKLN
jgi:hypothetical protein